MQNYIIEHLLERISVSNYKSNFIVKGGVLLSSIMGTENMATMEQMKIPLVIDITTGDKIIPKEIEYDYKLLFEDGKIKIMSYNIETVLLEKLYAILSLGENSTRMRNYYDVYILCNIYKNKSDINIIYKNR